MQSDQTQRTEEDARRLAEIDRLLANSAVPVRQNADWSKRYGWEAHDMIFLRRLLRAARAK